jgi:hypothetical protein
MKQTLMHNGATAVPQHGKCITMNDPSILAASRPLVRSARQDGTSQTVGRLCPARLGASLKKCNKMTVLDYVGGGIYGLCISLLILAIMKINKRIESTITMVEIETARLVEIELAKNRSV